jgi:hypothetical protein
MRLPPLTSTDSKAFIMTSPACPVLKLLAKIVPPFRTANLGVLIITLPALPLPNVRVLIRLLTPVGETPIISIDSEALTVIFPVEPVDSRLASSRISAPSRRTKVPVLIIRFPTLPVPEVSPDMIEL